MIGLPYGSAGGGVADLNGNAAFADIPDHAE
jgi:hypothetical protein